MNHTLVGMLAETFVHPGSGQNVGAIDLPVAREAATDYPFIAGSSLKGALNDAAGQKGMTEEQIDEIFGTQKPNTEKDLKAGNLLVSDARLLLLPVRSLSSAYKWVTCPHLLERLGRDLKRSGGQSAELVVPNINAKEALGKHPGEAKLFLEERSFTVKREVDAAVVTALKKLMKYEESKERLDKQLVIVSNDDFNWFAKYGLAVQARNQLNENKTSNNLWYEETLPPDTLMYSVLAERNSRNGNALQDIQKKVGDYLQVGGNETVGQGWFALRWLDGSSNE